MDLYFARHDGEAATVEQFVQCFADAAGTDLTQFMLWYSQAGTPEVVATGSYDARAKTYRLELAQTRAADPGQPDEGADGDPARARPGRPRRARPAAQARRRRARSSAACSRSTQAGRQLRVRQASASAPVPSLNRGFSAPVKLVANCRRDDLRFLAAHDSDPFNRWQALQTLATRLLVDNVAAIRARRARRAAMPACSTRSPRSSPTRRSSPPSSRSRSRFPARPTSPARSAATSIPTRSSRRAQALRAAIGQHLGDALAERYRALADTAPYRPDAAGAGRRALRNVCLDLLVAARRAGRDRARRAAISRPPTT